MNKKFEHHKEYPEAVYKDRVYKWFTDSTSTLSDADLQKFVDLCMRGNLTFQCADEIDIDGPDIDTIDHLLMDIASEKNDELINTYTDEIDWDNDYLEKRHYKNLETRVAKLEMKLLLRSVSNITPDDFLDRSIVEKIRSIVYNRLKNTCYVSDIRNECSEYDATGKFIRLFQFEITNIAEEWDDVDEYSETWDDMGGYDALAEAEDSKTYLFSNDNGSILVSCSDLDGYMREFGRFKSAIEAANAIVKSRDVY